MHVDYRLEVRPLSKEEGGGFAIPSPISPGAGRIPRSLHARLVERAKAEGVSLNTLVVALVAEGIGPRKSGQPRRRRARTLASESRQAR